MIQNGFLFYSGAPSVYQTASMLRVLYEVHTHFDNPIIDPVILVRSLDWLIRQQSEDGSFKEVFVYNGEYQRKLPIEFQEIALTAHVLISLSPFIEKVNLMKMFTRKCRMQLMFKSDSLESLILLSKYFEWNNYSITVQLIKKVSYSINI